MKTLVIHPHDDTTNVLSIIYKDKKDWTIINDCNISNNKLTEQIKQHDRIIMLGHGSPNGLFNPVNPGFLIDKRHVFYLRQMKNNVYIWCNADQFIKSHNLKNCFYTGMIISEKSEAVFCGVNSTLEEVNSSILLFYESIRDNIDLLEPKLMCENVISQYNIDYYENSNVMEYNRKRIYFS